MFLLLCHKENLNRLCKCWVEQTISAGECVLLNKNSNDWKQTSVVKSPCYQTALEWWEASGYFIRNMIDEKWCQLLHFNHVFVCILCTFVRVNEFSYDGIPKDGAFLTQVVHYVSVLGSGGIQFSVQRDCRCPQLESEQDSERERERNGNFRSSAGSGAGPGLESWSLPGSLTRVSASLSQVPEYQEAHVCVLSPVLVKPDQPAQTLAAWPEKSGLDKETITFQSIRENKNAISTIDNFVHGCWFVSQ